MASYLIVRHKVRDFSEWKPGYDAHLPTREEVGITEKYLLRGADDPNEVIIFFEAADLSRAKHKSRRKIPTPCATASPRKLPCNAMAQMKKSPISRCFWPAMNLRIAPVGFT